MAAGFLAMVVRFRTQPGQDSERASLLSNEQRIHVLAEVLEQAPRFSYRVPDSDIMAKGTRRLYYAGASMSSPLRILAVDVGTGTQDILLFESGKTMENCFKMVMPSPTVIVAERIKRATERGQPILLTGVTMGGGPCHWAARDHALAGYKVAGTPEAGRTFDDDLTMVEKMGFEIVGEQDAIGRIANSDVVHIELQDFDAHAIISALEAFDVEVCVDALAIAAFDHGAAPPGVSDR